MATQTADMPRAGKLGESGLMSWVMTVDHKKIGILYLITSFCFFLVGGLMALAIRTQLAAPELSFLDSNQYNQIFTMHATVMIFLVVMPLNAGLGNYLVPLMIGARDMAFPKLNALSYWLYLFGGLLILSSFVMGGAPDTGWFAYAPLTVKPYSVNHAMDFWGVSILILGISTTIGSINFIVTVAQLRAPGMTLGRTPVFVWMVLVTAFLAVFSLPSLTTGVGMLLLDRLVGTHFFVVAKGGSALLWQHLFWFFGHPEVYILILPAFGILSEVIPVFSGKPLFGYKVVILSGAVIGILGFTVWAHHMFATGMPTVALLIFAADSFLIGVPTGVKIFAWIGTMFKGKLRFTTPMMFAIGTVALFTIGGLDGIHLAVLPVDWQLTDTYYVVSHIHYVLFGGALMGLMSGAFYWFPKMFGRRLGETLGKWQFWIMFIGMNLTFMPMHVVGILGMPRRIYTYAPGLGWDIWNLMATVGAEIIALGVILFAINLIKTMRKPADAPNDPWDAFTLEWKTSSPPPAYNFEVIPTVSGPRPLWDEKHPELADAKHGH